MANCPSDSDVRAFIEEKRHALRAERKGAGRDVLLRAAMNHFGLSRKIALSIWSARLVIAKVAAEKCKTWNGQNAPK